MRLTTAHRTARPTRRRHVVAAMAVALFWAATAPGAAGEAAVADVTITADAFNPGEVRVTAGTTVRWQVDDLGTHDVTAVDGSFASGQVVTGLTFEHTFDEPGTYPYVCTLHGRCDEDGCRGQVGTIVVEAVAQQATPPGPRTASAAPAEPAEPADEAPAPQRAPEPAPAPQRQGPPPPSYGAPPEDRGEWWTVTMPLIVEAEVPSPLVAPPRDRDEPAARPPVPPGWTPSAYLAAPAPATEPVGRVAARWLMLASIVAAAVREHQRRGHQPLGYGAPLR